LVRSTIRNATRRSATSASQGPDVLSGIPPRTKSPELAAGKEYLIERRASYQLIPSPTFPVLTCLPLPQSTVIRLESFTESIYDRSASSLGIFYSLLIGRTQAGWLRIDRDLHDLAGELVVTSFRLHFVRMREESINAMRLATPRTPN
jgi:hypothetical protein